MDCPIEFDQRYKINQDIVDKMRELRKEGQTYQQIADNFDVSFHTAYYWCNEKYRIHKQGINAQRRNTGKAREIQIARQTKRRKEKWNKHPETRIESDYWSAKAETRVKRHTSKGRSMEELESQYNKTKSITNQKVN